jgi:hypothetical protein
MIFRMNPEAVSSPDVPSDINHPTWLTLAFQKRLRLGNKNKGSVLGWEAACTDLVRVGCVRFVRGAASLSFLAEIQA